MDPWVEEALVSRCCLPLVAALLHVPKLQALNHKQSNPSIPGQSPQDIQVHLLTSRELEYSEVSPRLIGGKLLKQALYYSSPCL